MKNFQTNIELNTELFCYSGIGRRNHFSEHHVYGVTKAFDLRVRGDSANNVILCEACDKEAQSPIDVGALPKCIL